MKLGILTKPILFLTFLVLVNTVQKPLKITVLAQDITQKKQLTTLSTQEKTDLKQGKVVLKGQSGNYRGQVLAAGDLNTAWKVLTDYDNFDNFLPNIASSQVISASGGRTIFEQVNVVDLWLFTEKFTVQIEAMEAKPKTVKFKQFKGDLEELNGIWEIEQIDTNQILVTHTVKVEPGSNTEKPFFYGVYESSLEDTLKAIALEITNRSQVIE